MALTWPSILESLLSTSGRLCRDIPHPWEGTYLYSYSPRFSVVVLAFRPLISELFSGSRIGIQGALIVLGSGAPVGLPICWAYLPLPVAMSCRFPIPLSQVLSLQVLIPSLFRASGASVAILGTPLPAAIVHPRVVWRVAF